MTITANFLFNVLRYFFLVILVVIFDPSHVQAAEVNASDSGFDTGEYYYHANWKKIEPAILSNEQLLPANQVAKIHELFAVWDNQLFTVRERLFWLDKLGVSESDWRAFRWAMEQDVKKEWDFKYFNLAVTLSVMFRLVKNGYLGVGESLWWLSAVKSINHIMAEERNFNKNQIANGQIEYENFRHSMIAKTVEFAISVSRPNNSLEQARFYEFGRKILKPLTWGQSRRLFNPKKQKQEFFVKEVVDVGIPVLGAFLIGIVQIAVGGSPHLPTLGTAFAVAYSVSRFLYLPRLQSKKAATPADEWKHHSEQQLFHECARLLHYQWGPNFPK